MSSSPDPPSQRLPDAPDPAEDPGGPVPARLHDFLSSRSPSTLTRANVCAVLILGIIDYHIVPDLDPSLFYLAPIAIASWYGPARAGYLLCVLAAAVWLTADHLTQPIPPELWVTAWNLSARLATFLLVAALLVRLQDGLATQRSLALTDQLTGLANTRAFLRQLEDETDRARRYGGAFSLAYLDLDRFKPVNDTLGHAEGDKVLRRIAQVMRDAMRTTDVTARLGGDEFGILLPETSYAEAAGALEKLRGKLLDAMQEGGWPVTVSVGGVTFETPIGSPDDAIRLTDELMYQVKDRGGDGIEHILWTESPTRT